MGEKILKSPYDKEFYYDFMYTLAVGGEYDALLTIAYIKENKYKIKERKSRVIRLGLSENQIVNDFEIINDYMSKALHNYENYVKIEYDKCRKYIVFSSNIKNLDRKSYDGFLWGGYVNDEIYDGVD